MIAAVALAAAALALPHASSGDTVHVVVMYEVFTTQVTCEEMRYDPVWGHVPYGEFELRDSAGRLLGASALDLGMQTPTSCMFSTQFDANVAPDGLYQAGIGGAEVDANTFTEEYMVNGMLVAAMSLNDMNRDRVPDAEEGSGPVSEYQQALQLWSPYDPSCEAFLDGLITDSHIATVFSGDPAVARQVLDDHCPAMAPLFEQD